MGRFLYSSEKMKQREEEMDRARESGKKLGGMGVQKEKVRKSSKRTR